MSSCNIPIDSFQTVDGSLNVSEKYAQLMQDSMGEDSLYTRAKDTMFVQFDNLNLTAEEKAKVVSESIVAMTVQLSGAAMQTALAWETGERDGAYNLAQVKAQTELVQAQFVKTEEEICSTIKKTELTCAQITATISATFRENGVPTAYEADGCRPTALDETGLKFHQTKQVEAATYQAFADAFRKSGVVQIGTDISDTVTKGLSGDEEGYTHQQILNAERQRVAYEDSKRNHAANSASQMIGQLLSSETLSTSNEQDVQRWREAVDFLNTSHSSTDLP
ncbi:MAG: hypothetical protein DRQ78_08805 [Epsilonproteobacteria bacterium]|nr:MAG: hypothetical protein DRQ78_08805 [Campylobacterota bacterium]